MSHRMTYPCQEILLLSSLHVQRSHTLLSISQGFSPLVGTKIPLTLAAVGIQHWVKEGQQVQAFVLEDSTWGGAWINSLGAMATMGYPHHLLKMKKWRWESSCKRGVTQFATWNGQSVNKLFIKYYLQAHSANLVFPTGVKSGWTGWSQGDLRYRSKHLRDPTVYFCLQENEIHPAPAANERHTSSELCWDYHTPEASLKDH